MLTEVVHSLYRYNTWANARIVEAAATCRPAQLREPGGASFDSVHDTLVHTLGAQWLYLERWHGRSPRAMPAAAEFVDLAAVRARWDAIERDTQTFVGALSDARLGETIAFTYFQGARRANPPLQHMIHQLNLTPPHRSEA